MDDYEIGQLIGSGSFGKVFMGRKKSTNEYVAVKKISKGGRSEQEILALCEECDIQRRLHHPHIIQMLDSFETDDSVVVVTEYAQGDLWKLLISLGKLPEGKVQPIARHIVSALYFIHSHRILHRDIKPQNILIGWDGRAKLCDFGFAKTMDINTYMLTSVKGTPLYMSPEILKGKPYDHNADLWSLGCIVYELLVGFPPFYTTVLFQLVDKIKNEEIKWPLNVSTDCLTFLQGLLQKDPQKRLTWPALLNHPFVREGLFIDKTVPDFSLTKILSPSQELAKEKQRLILQTNHNLNSKRVKKPTKNFDEAKKCTQQGTPVNTGKNAAKVVFPTTSNVKTNKPVEKEPVVVQTDDDERDDDTNSGTSSCETMTSSSDFETDVSDADDDTNTVIMESQNSRISRTEGGASVENSGNTKDSRGEGGILWKSGALFTLRLGTEDKEINTEEWIYFIMSTMKEVIENPRSLCEKHFLTMLVAPLRNHLAEPEVIEKIARLLSLPFTLDKSFLEREPSLMEQLQVLYLDTKVLPNLLYSCKLIVRRRRVGRGSLTLDEIPSILTLEDLEGLEKCLSLITFLVYMDEDYVTQICDSLCVLQAFQIFQLFLKLDFMRPELTADTVALLCHILRIFPTNKSIIEEIFLDGHDNNSADSELWRMLTHSNHLIQSRAIRLYTYLCLNSEKVKTDFVSIRRPQVWKILRRAAISSHVELRVAAEFSLQALNHRPSSIPSNSSGKSSPAVGSSSAPLATSTVKSTNSETQCTSTYKRETASLEKEIGIASSSKIKDNNVQNSNFASR